MKQEYECKLPKGKTCLTYKQNGDRSGCFGCSQWQPKQQDKPQMYICPKAKDGSCKFIGFDSDLVES